MQQQSVLANQAGRRAGDHGTRRKAARHDRVGAHDTPGSEPHIWQDDAAHPDETAVADLEEGILVEDAIANLARIIALERMGHVHERAIRGDGYIVADRQPRMADDVDVLLDVHATANRQARSPAMR